jgi:hypothetical protein
MGRMGYDCTFSPRVRTYAETIAALPGRHVKIVGINAGGNGPGNDAGPDLRMLARDTGSVDEGGLEVVYDLPISGAGIDAAIIDGIEKLSYERIIDVTTRAAEVPFIDDGIDSTLFIKDVAPTGFVLPSPETTPPTFDADNFYGVTPGTVLRYRVDLQNDIVRESDRPQVFLVELRGFDEGGNQIDAIRLMIIVPALDLERIEGDVVECTGVGECDDGVPCTLDACEGHRCVHAPRDDACDDGNACNGREACRPDIGYRDARGCIGGIGVVCNTNDPCILGACNSSTGLCEYWIVDGDGDGYGAAGCQLCDEHGVCVFGDDCNDVETAVNPGATEVCADGVDNNCDDLTDLMDPACIPTNDTCASPTFITGEGTFIGSLRGTADDYATGCGDPMLNDVVFSFTLTEDHDVGLRVMGAFDAFISVQTACGDLASELYCGRNSLWARGLHAGTYTVIVEGAVADAFRMSLELAPFTSVYNVPPTNDNCLSPYVLPDTGGLFIGSTVGMLNDFTASCGSSSLAPDAVFELTLAAARTVDITTTTDYDGTLHVHGAPCGSGAEVACNDDSPDTRHSHLNLALAAGTYYIVVDGYGTTYAGNYEMNVVITP